MHRLTCAILAAVALFAFPLFAEERAVKRQLLSELMEVLDAKALTQASFDAVFDNMMTMQKAEEEADVEPEERKQREEMLARQEKEMNAFRERLYSRIDYEKYAEEVYVPLFDEHFDSQGLQELITFLKTKPGRSMIAVLPKLGAGAMMRGSKLIQEAAMQAQEEMAKEKSAKYPWLQTMADMRSLATAVEARATDENSYPDVDLDALEPLVTPTYIRTMPKEDQWGTRFLYIGNGDHYRVVSAGADKRFDWNARQFENVEEGMQPRLSKSLDADIIFQDGTFTQIPQAAAENRE